MSKRGRPFSDDPKRNKVTLRMTDDEYKKLENMSKDMHMSVADSLRTMITNYKIRK